MQKNKNGLVYHLAPNHPLIRSLVLVEGPAKPIYSIAEIAGLWQWTCGNYSKERVRQLLDQMNVKIYNRSNKGLIYLCDIMKVSDANIPNKTYGRGDNGWK